MKKVLAATAFAVLLSTGSIAFTTTSASADVVCNNEGDCWHVKDHYTYPPGITIQVHPEDWKWGEKEKFKWHEPQGQGRGYWKNGIWIGF
jgi:hypothetical protein